MAVTGLLFFLSFHGLKDKEGREEKDSVILVPVPPPMGMTVPSRTAMEIGQIQLTHPGQPRRQESNEI